MKKIIAIVQARMGSKRLPGKVLNKIKGHTFIELIIARLKNSIFLKQILLEIKRTEFYS